MKVSALQVADSPRLERVATADGLKCAGAKRFRCLEGTVSADPPVAVIGTTDVDRDLLGQP